MSIQKRLILSNIGMIILPILSLFVMEIVLGFIFFVFLNRETDSRTIELFSGLRFFTLLLVLIVTNGLLTYFVSRSILKPIQKLSQATERIKQGDLDYSVYSNKKDELAKLSNNFEEMRISLKEARSLQDKYEENRQELIASISHDLKTPITSIKGYIQGIHDGVANSPEKLSRYLSTIYQKAEQMDGLIDELFLYSKLDLAQVPFDFEPLDLHAFLHDFLGELTFYQDDLEVDLNANQNEQYLIYADRDKIYRAITNIMQNSLKYMNKKDQKIVVSLQSVKDHVEMVIRDNGLGIAPDELPFIFNSFYRADSSRNSSTGGSGLGLSIVKKIVDAHGGTIWAESKEKNGTSIYIRFKKVR